MLLLNAMQKWLAKGRRTIPQCGDFSHDRGEGGMLNVNSFLLPSFSELVCFGGCGN